MSDSYSSDNDLLKLSDDDDVNEESEEEAVEDLMFLIYKVLDFQFITYKKIECNQLLPRCCSTGYQGINLCFFNILSRYGIKIMSGQLIIIKKHISTLWAISMGHGSAETSEIKIGAEVSSAEESAWSVFMFGGGKLFVMLVVRVVAKSSFIAIVH
ncbi:hypothetical protein WA026_011335 [Henosepilachna vigintioctopunctata]|uniref:Uncharacterized protein n=1 Tax=Henosepilachna vigintioctopunctata TaxID=420089 RepID=A0AAW1U112_9CUCU